MDNKVKDEINKLQISFTVDSSGKINGAMGVVRGNDKEEFTSNRKFIQSEIGEILPANGNSPQSSGEKRSFPKKTANYATKIEPHSCTAECEPPRHICDTCGSAAYVSSHPKRDGSGNYTRLDCENGHKFWPSRN